MTDPVKQTPTLKNKVESLALTILEDSKMGVANQVVIKGLVRSLIAGVSDAEIESGLVTLRDEIIPFLLGESNGKNSTKG